MDHFTLNELETPAASMEEALRVLINSILFTRQTASVNQVRSDCGISYFTVKDQEVKDSVELQVKLLARVLKAKGRGVVSLSFQDEASTEVWEQWNCPFNITDTGKMDEGLRARIFEVLQIVCSHSAHIPFRKCGDQGKFPFKLSCAEVNEQGLKESSVVMSDP
jgi:hypothetical protein